MTINYLSLLVSMVGALAIGTVWFGPLFGEIYIKGLGFKSMADARKAFAKKPNGKRDMYLTYIFQLTSSAVVAAFVGALVGAGEKYACFFVVTIAFFEYGILLWHGRSQKFNLVSIGGQLVIVVYYIIIAHLLGSQIAMGA